MNILLIEPDLVLAKTYTTYLKQLGNNVVTSPNAQSAVHQAEDFHPDVVVLELQLANHSGVEFLYEFRSYPEWQHIPVILHTMVPPQSLAISEALLDQLHISAYLYKPSTTLKKLNSTIQEVTTLIKV